MFCFFSGAHTPLMIPFLGGQLDWPLEATLAAPMVYTVYFVFMYVHMLLFETMEINYQSINELLYWPELKSMCV